VDDEKTKIQNYSVKKLMGDGDEPESASYAGLRLNGAAHENASSYETSDGKGRKSIERLILKLALQENLEAMSKAVDDYIEMLRDELAVLEIERDTLASGIEQLENDLRLIEARLISINDAIDLIEEGEELELDGDENRLKDPNVEALISGYERAKGISVDRSDTALLLAILRAEEERIEPEKMELEKRVREEKERLQEIEDEITEHRDAISDAEKFKEELDRISAITDDVERERQMQELIENTPKHLLSELAENGLIEPAEDLSAENRNNEDFLSQLDLDADEPETIASPPVPKPFG